MIVGAVSLPAIYTRVEITSTLLKGIGWKALLLESEEYMRTKIKKSMPINPDEVMKNVREDLATGRLSEKLRSRGVPMYSASKENPGYIERCQMDGSIEVGRMVNGEFVLKKSDTHE